MSENQELSYSGRTLSIRARLMGSLVIILFLLLLVIGLNYFFTMRLTQTIASLHSEAARANASLRVGKATSDLVLTVERAVASQSAAYVSQNVQQAAQALSSATGTLTESVQLLPERDPMRTEVGRIQNGVTRLVQMAGDLVVVAQEGDWTPV